MSRILEALRQMDVQRHEDAPAPAAAMTGAMRRQKPSADDAESDPRFLHLVDHLLRRFSPGRPAVLLVTSPGPEPDKARVTAALAEALSARLPGDVLAVDGPAEASEVAETPRIFSGRHRSGGLGGVLAGEATWEDSICRTPRDWLDVLPGATAAGRFSAMTSVRLAAVLEDLRCRYRFVVIDGPCAAQPEAVTMAACCDGVLVVVALGRTGRAEARRAVAVLERGGARVLGCVVAGA